MSRINTVCVVCALSAWALGAWTPGARGGFARATLSNSEAFDDKATTGTFSVNAYSEENGEKNAAVTSMVTVNGKILDQLPTNKRGYSMDTKGQAISIPTGQFKKNSYGKMVEDFQRLGPTARLLNNEGNSVISKAWLKKEFDIAKIDSKTGQFEGYGFYSISPDFKNFGQTKRVLLAEATSGEGLPPFPGDAAGQAGDPFSIPSGSPLAYDPLLNDSIQLDAGESGGAVSWASDSSVFTSDSMDNYMQDGAPLDQTLWYLSLGGQGPISSTSAVQIDFELNPLALNEIAFPTSFLTGLGSYNDATSEAALIDQSIDQTVAGALALNGNEVDLSGFDPFPTGTTFSAISGGVEYADGVDAGIEGGSDMSGVPAPHSWLLLATGFLGLLGIGWRRRKLSLA